jgi:hypothetical protein
MAESAPKHAGRLTYLQPTDLDKICFLQEALYWVAFGRLPIYHMLRTKIIDCYETNIPRENGELSDAECEKAGLPRDPRLNYAWAWVVMLSDPIETIVEACKDYDPATGEFFEHEGISTDEARREAEKLLDEMTQWKPKFERAIELGASEVYTALRKGLLTSKGVRLPDPDVAVSLTLLAEQNKALGDLEVVTIPKDFWSLHNIYWEISAARNDIEHYCHIQCMTDDLTSLFPFDVVTTGEPVDGVTRHGSFFVLSPNSGAAVAPTRRAQARGRVGRHPLYRWDDLHVEMAGLVRKGLPKKESAVEHLREFYRLKFGSPVPAVRTLHQWLEPYYNQYFGK